MTPDEAASKFPKGARVRLNIGGPDMVVKSHVQTAVWCQWFVGKKLEAGQFAAESLVLVPEDASPKA